MGGESQVTVAAQMPCFYEKARDGKIAEEFWERRSAEWHEEERRIVTALQTVHTQPAERLLDAARILELSNKAYFLYLGQSPAERAKLLRIVLSNCSLDAANVYPAYRKPFDLILARAIEGMVGPEGFEPSTNGL